MSEEQRALLKVTADLTDYAGEVDMAIKDCISRAVQDAIYDVLKADVRRAYLASDLRETVLPQIVDATLRRMAQEAL